LQKDRIANLVKRRNSQGIIQTQDVNDSMTSRIDQSSNLVRHASQDDKLTPIKIRKKDIKIDVGTGTGKTPQPKRLLPNIIDLNTNE
jgi:hypothetical protein